jgi:hypothetical protein
LARSVQKRAMMQLFSLLRELALVYPFVCNHGERFHFRSWFCVPRFIGGSTTAPKNRIDTRTANQTSKRRQKMKLQVPSKKHSSRSALFAKSSDIESDTTPNVANDVNQTHKLNEGENRDDVTGVYHSDDNDSYTYTLNSVDNDDFDEDAETRYSRQYSTCTDDDDSRFTSQVKLSISDDDEADDGYDDNRSLLSVDTDADRTLTTVEERDFEIFARRQDLLAASREEKEASARGHNTGVGIDATKYSSPTTDRFCANLFELCGFLGDEIADDVDPQTTKSKDLEEVVSTYDKEEEDEASPFDDYDVYKDDEATVNQAVEESVLDIFGDFDSSHAVSAHKAAADEEDTTSNKGELEDFLRNFKDEEQAPEEKKRKGWGKFRPPMKLLPMMNAKRDSEKCTSIVEKKYENILNADPRVKESPISNEVSMGPTSPRKPSNVLQRFKNTLNSTGPATASIGVGAGELVTALTRPATRLPKASQDVVSADDSAAPEVAPDEIGDIAGTRTRNVSLDEIPFSASTIARGRSITKEHFHQVIEREEAKVRTIKKVKVGTDEHGNDTFAYLVIMSENQVEMDPAMKQRNESNAISQLIRGKIDDLHMELSLARTHSLDMVLEKNQENFGEGCQFILMEVDDLTVGEAPVHEPVQNFEDDVRREKQSESFPSETNDREGAESDQQDQLPLHAPTARNFRNPNAEHTSTRTKAELENGNDNSVLEVLSFESVITDKIVGVDEFSEDVVATVPMTRDPSTTTQAFVIPLHHDELMLMEAEDDDEIEIELDDEEAEEANEEMQLSAPSDCPAVILGAATTPNVNTADEKKLLDVTERYTAPRRRRMIPLKKFWKSKKRANSHECRNK